MNDNRSILAKQLFDTSQELADLLVNLEEDGLEHWSLFSAAVVKAPKLIITNQPLALNTLENAQKRYLPEIGKQIEESKMLDKQQCEQALLVYNKIDQTVTDLIQALNPQEQNDKANDSGISISCQS